MQKRETVINSQLEENANLLESLAKEQKERLSRPVPTNLNNLPNPTSKELNLGRIIFYFSFKVQYSCVYPLDIQIIVIKQVVYYI